MLFILFVVYDSGSIFSPDILDISDDDLLKKFTQVIKKLLLMIKPTNHVTIT